MKRLNQKEWEVMRDALSVKQLEKVQLEGMLLLNKQEMIDALKRSNKEVKEIVLDNLKNITDEYKDVREKLEKNGKLHIEKNTKLLNKLENDNNDYEVSFLKGGK